MQIKATPFAQWLVQGDFYQLELEQEQLLFTSHKYQVSVPFDKWSDFRDLENPGSHEELDPVTLRAEYLDRVRGFISQIEVACGQMEIDYVPMNTRVPFEVALSGFLASRRNGQK